MSQDDPKDITAGDKEAKKKYSQNTKSCDLPTIETCTICKSAPMWTKHHLHRCLRCAKCGIIVTASFGKNSRKDIADKWNSLMLLLVLGFSMNDAMHKRQDQQQQNIPPLNEQLQKATDKYLQSRILDSNTAKQTASRVMKRITDGSD